MKLDNLYCIAAISMNGVLADSKNPGMLWKCSDELKHFKRTTMDSVVVMGKTTAELVGKLPGRDCIVLSKDPNYQLTGFATLTVDKFLECARSNPTVSFMICGGGQIYELLMPYCKIAIISEMKLVVDGDIRLPILNNATLYSSKEYDQFNVNCWAL